MLRWPSIVSCALSFSVVAWSCVASAQGEGTPPGEQPPLSPTPIQQEPPTEPAPTSPPAPASPPAPGSAPPSSQPTPAPRAADAFSPPAPSSPSPAPASPTRAAERTPAHEEAAAPTQAPSDGLFQRRTGHGQVHHHQDEGRAKETDQFKIGPVVGTGVPSVISFGGTIKVTRFLGAGVNVGLIPKVRLSYYGDATLSYQHYDIYGRVYPFGGGFFLSGGAGYATVDGTLTNSQSFTGNVQGQNVSATANYTARGTVRTLMLTALVGYFYTTRIGFSIGVDAGAQIPIAPSRIDYSSSDSISTNPAGLQSEFERQAEPYVSRANQSVQDTLEKIGRTTIPTVNLRIGWIL